MTGQVVYAVNNEQTIPNLVRFLLELLDECHPF